MIESTQLPPHSEESEAGTLGACMLERSALDYCLAEGVSGEWFYVPANRVVWECIEGIANRGRPIDLLIVGDELRKSGAADKVGGDLYLNRLVDKCSTTAHIEYYLAGVKDAWLKRQAIVTARTVEVEAYGPEDAHAILESATSRFTMIGERQEPTSVPAVVDQVIADIAAVQAGEIRKDTISTGYPDLDNILEGGLRLGGMYIIAAPKSTGKSTLGFNILNHMIQNNVPSGLVSLEMQPRQVVDRLIAIASNQPVARIMQGKTRSTPEVDIAAAHLRQAPFWLTTNCPNDVAFRAWARRMVEKRGVKLIVLDYIQNLDVKAQGKQSEYEQITRASRTVTQVARELGVCVIAVSSLSNEGNLRGSGQLNYDAYSTWILSKKGEPVAPMFHYDMNLYMDKNRFGPENVTLGYSMCGATGKITENLRDLP